MRDSLRLAAWVANECDASRIAYTHVKLQKLCFYAYGVAAAHGEDGALGDVTFHAWKHGPVMPDLAELLMRFKAEIIPAGEVLRIIGERLAATTPAPREA